jgi:hypothetical protein
MPTENKKQKSILCIEDHDDTCGRIALVLNDDQVISAKTEADALPHVR